MRRTLCNRGCDAPLYGRKGQLYGGCWWWRAPSTTPALESSGNAAYILVAQGLLYHVAPRHLGSLLVTIFPSGLIISRYRQLSLRCGRRRSAEARRNEYLDFEISAVFKANLEVRNEALDRWCGKKPWIRVRVNVRITSFYDNEPCNSANYARGC